MKSINKSILNEDLDDIIDDEPLEEEPLPEVNQAFNANLAESFLSESALNNLSSYLLNAIKQDISASEDWLSTIKKVEKFLGFNVEDTDDIPFHMATRTVDTTLANAVLRFYATARAEILQPEGPAGFRIVGESNDFFTNKGEKLKKWYNYYLTVVDKPFYSDYEKFLMHVGFEGCGYRKTYYDPLLRRPITRYIRVEDFLIDGDCNNILDSTRLTHVLHLSKREILLNQQNGTYLDIELSTLNDLNDDEEEGEEKEEGVEDFDLNAYDKRSLFPIYECHTYLDLKDFDDNVEEDDIPLPYIVVIDPTSKKILSVKRNWKEDDELKKRREYFIQYNYLPGFGPRGMGLAHIIGTNAISITTILRELVDAGKFKNLPGGFRAKGVAPQNNNMIVGPGEWKELDLHPGMPWGEVFYPLPYSEPSQVLHQLRLEMIEQTKELASTSELGMLSSREDIPTGTVLAQLEYSNKIQSAVLRSIHFSFTQELQLLDQIFRETMGNDFFETVNGESISYADFVDEVQIIPICDPASNSTMQKIMKGKATLELAMQDPSIYNMYEVHKMNHKAQGLDDSEIEMIMIPPPQEQQVLPLDPASENVNILLGKPVTTAKWQAHDAHNIDHYDFMNNTPNLTEKQIAELFAHTQEHEAQKYLLKVEQLLGYELPSLEELTDPEIQNSIAIALAERLPQAEQQTAQGEGLDDNAVLLADIQQREEETKARERIAQLKAETDIFKSQLDFEKEKAKIESNEDIAQLKSETELAKVESNKPVFEAGL